MNSFCKKCGACCKNIKIDKSKQIIVWDNELPLNKEFETMLLPINTKLGIYTCKYLKNNLCTNPNKPDICKNYPSFPFIQLPENCGYEGIIFLKKEDIKHKIRKIKEEILNYTILLETTKDKKEKQQYKKLIDIRNKSISKYKDFDSEDW